MHCITEGSMSWIQGRKQGLVFRNNGSDEKNAKRHQRRTKNMEQTRGEGLALDTGKKTTPRCS